MWRVARVKSRRKWAALADHLGHLRPEDVHDLPRNHSPSEVPDRRAPPVDVLAEEISGLAGSKDNALALIEYATAEPFSFLFVRLDAKTRKDTFWLRFEKRLSIEETDDHADEQLDDGKREVEQIRAHGHESGQAAGRTQPARRARN